MASQKLENLRNLSLEATAEEREQSLELPVGVEEDRWELIIKYHGNLGEALQRAGFPETLQAEYLLTGYAIVTATRDQIERLSALPENDYKNRAFFGRAGAKPHLISLGSDDTAGHRERAGAAGRIFS